MTNRELEVGIFREELKNRFLCLVEIDGKDTICYIPSSCRLSNFLKLDGKSVLLTRNQGKSNRTQYSVFAVKNGRNYVLLNMSVSNRVIEDNIQCKRFSFLGKRKKIFHETTVCGYKADLFIQESNTIIEVKSLLTLEKNASFPTVHSDRAIEQLRKLSLLLEENIKVCYLFVSLNPYTRRVKINTTEDIYWNLFKECISKGMDIYGVSICLKEGTPCIYGPVQVEVK